MARGPLFRADLSHFNSAIGFLEEERYEEAVSSLETAQAAHHKQSGQIQAMIGMAHVGLENYEAALHHLNQAVEIRDSAFHRANRATGYMAQDQCQEASTDAETALGMKTYTEPGYHSGSVAHMVLAICQYDVGDLENALQNIRASIDLANKHGYPGEGIRDLEEIEWAIAEGADSAAVEPDLAQKYRDAGAALDSQRDGTTTWADGSHWQDGSSHQLPDLPLEPEVRILSRMTCAQWEALNMAVFPQGEGYSEFNWHEHPDADVIGQKWKENLAEAVWGRNSQALTWLERESFPNECG